MKKALTALAVFVMTAAPAVACVGFLVRTDLLMNGVACTYQLSDGSYYRVVITGQAYCPPCL